MNNFWHLEKIEQQLYFKTGLHEVFRWGEETVRDLYEILNKETLPRIFTIKPL